eukprot:6740363-Pyramimonas_sp.AAC.1
MIQPFNEYERAWPRASRGRHALTRRNVRHWRTGLSSVSQRTSRMLASLKRKTAAGVLHRPGRLRRWLKGVTGGLLRLVNHWGIYSLCCFDWLTTG